MATPPATPVVRVNLSDQLSERVLDLIAREKLGPGDRLPSVGALAKRFGVATPTMREALRGLEATGVVDIRHGSGVYVRRNYERLMVINPYYGALEYETVIDLLEARELIEPPLAELAAGRMTEADHAELERLLGQAERHLLGAEGDDRILQRVNQQFHAKIAACAGNAVLSQVVASLHDLHVREQLVIFHLYNDPSDDHEQHKAIFEALRGRKPNRARKLMKQHIRTVKAVIESKRESG